MKIIVPAYSIDPKLATKYEAEIAAIMHNHRAQELENLRPKKNVRLTATPAGALARTLAAARRGPLEPQEATGHQARQKTTEAAPKAPREPAPTLIIKAEFARYQPGKTSPTDELIVKILVAYARSRNQTDTPGLAASDLADTPGLAASDLAHKLNISRQAINAALARLQRKKLVKAIPVKDIPYSQRSQHGTSLKAVWVVATR